MNPKHQWNSTGYNAEELYFEKVNRELIEQIKKQNAKEKPTEGDSETSAQVIPFEPREKQKKTAKAA
jgi:hypothetical protein